MVYCFYGNYVIFPVHKTYYFLRVLCMEKENDIRTQKQTCMLVFMPRIMVYV